MSSEMREVLAALRAIDPFPSRVSRKNALPKGHTKYVGFCFGKVKALDKGYVRSRFDARFPDLLKAARRLIKAHDPSFKYTSIQVNKNMKCIPHKDTNNIGMSYIIGLGKYTGGHLALGDDPKTLKKVNIRNKFFKFDGRHTTHQVTPFEGERYSLVYFTTGPRTPK